MKSIKEITQLLDTVNDEVSDRTTKFPSMTYEEGIQAALDWVLDNCDENPLE